MTQSNEANGLGMDTRQSLVDAGRALFGRTGFDGTSVRAITERAGANLGAITYHFGSKGGLYAAVLEEGLRPIADRVVEVGRSPGTARERIGKIVEVYFDHFAAQPDLPHLLLQEIAAGKEPPPVVPEILRQIMGTLVALHDEGVRDGTIVAGDPMLTALSVIAQPIYMTLVSPMLKAVGGLDLGHPETRRVTVAHATRFVDAGLRPDAEPPVHQEGPE